MPSLMDYELRWEQLAHKHIFVPFYQEHLDGFWPVQYRASELGADLQNMGIDVLCQTAGEGRQFTIDEKAVRGLHAAFFVEKHGRTYDSSTPSPGWIDYCRADYVLYSMSDATTTQIHRIKWRGHAQDYLLNTLARQPHRWNYTVAKRSTKAAGWLVPVADLGGWVKTHIVSTPSEIADELSSPVVDIETRR